MDNNSVEKLLKYFTDENVISVQQGNLIKQQSDFNELGAGSSMMKYLKIPERVIISGIEKVFGIKLHAISDAKLPQEVEILNASIVRTMNAAIVDADEKNVYIAFLTTGVSLSTERNRLIKMINDTFKNRYSVTPVQVLDYALILKLLSVGSLANEVKVLAEAEPLTIVKMLIMEAIANEASDLHIETIWDAQLEAYVGRVQVRVAPDLINWEKSLFTVKEIQNMFSCLMDACGVPTADGKRAGGVTKMNYLGFPDHTFRIAVLPSHMQSSDLRDERDDPNGYCLTIRITRRTSTAMSIEQLNLGKKASDALKAISTSKSGFFAIGGITGSGKNTTTSSMVKYACEHGAVSGIEMGEPIEYQLPITQVQVNDYEMMKTLVRSIKTHDRDLVIITEFRDKEMGVEIKDIVISGVRVITTLHVSRVWDVFEKLRAYFGEEDSRTILSYMSGVCVQMAFRELCECKRELPKSEMTQTELLAYSNLGLTNEVVYTARSKKEVEDSGDFCFCLDGFTKKRSPVAEVLYFDPRDKDAQQLKQNILMTDKIEMMVHATKQYMKQKKIMAEFEVRDRIINGKIDFRKFVENSVLSQDISEEVKK